MASKKDSEVVDIIVKRYLRNESVRGLLHEDAPLPSAKTPAPTTNQSKNKQQSKPPVVNQPPSITFAPLLQRVGLPDIRMAAPKSTKWAKNITELLTKINANDTKTMAERYKNFHSELLQPRSIVPGCFYSFRYEAATVDAYDRFPMILALHSDSKGFLGMNFHYLPLPMRFALFEALMPLVIPIPVIQRSRIYMTYQQMMRRRLTGKLVTIKRYNFKQLRSGVVFISPLEWPVALAYPSETFINTNRVKVWAASQKASIGKSR